MKKSHAYLLGVWFLGAVTLAGAGLGCSSSSNNPGTGGGGASGQGGQAGGGQAGGAGAGGKTDGGADGIDAASAFMAFAPCKTESAYASNMTEIDFGGT